MDLRALKAELAADPAGLGYAGKTAAEKAGLYNGANRTRERGVIAAHEIIDATAPADWAALSAAEKSRYEVLTGAGQVNVGSANVRAAFIAMFPAGSATRTALAALATEAISRARELGTRPITASDVTAAEAI